MPFDAASRFFVSIQHRLFYIVMSLARFNLYANSYGFLARRAFKRGLGKRERRTYAAEILGIVVFWLWFGRVLYGCGSWQKALAYLLVSHIATSPIHIQVSISLSFK